MGLSVPKCCIPDVMSLDSKDDGGEARRGGGAQGGIYGTSILVDEVAPASLAEEDVIVLRNDQTPELARSAMNQGDDFGAPSSATLLNELDYLTSPEWQTMPQTVTTALDMQLLEEARTAPDSAATYTVALRSLWHNCPDALEAALDRVNLDEVSPAQARDAELMRQKLEFTRIRQQFVALCMRFREDGSAADFEAGISAVDGRLAMLITLQPDEQASQLPALVQKRDTIMLRHRIQTITQRLLQTAERGTM